MARKRDIGKKSDVNKYIKEVKENFYDKANKASRNGKYKVKCPNCDKEKEVKFSNGKGKCPTCKMPINLS